MAKIEIVETDENPLCPHCKKELTKILKRYHIGGPFGEDFVVFICPFCKVLLSVQKQI